MRRTIVLICIVLCTNTLAWAEGSRQPVVKLDPVAVKLNNDAARQHYLQAKLSYRARDYTAAQAGFQRAYRGERQAEILFDIAACLAHQGKMARAFATHRRYVSSFREPGARLIAAARFGKIMKEIRAKPSVGAR